MSDSEPLIRNISDTARWAAMYRAAESDRPALFFTIDLRGDSRVAAAKTSPTP